MREEIFGHSFKVGLVIALALIVLAVGIIGITSKQKIFRTKVKYYSVFPEAMGLKEGDSVRFQGVDVGFVYEIDFPEDPAKKGIIVRYKIESRLLSRIYTTARASIKSVGLLGDKYLALSSPAMAQYEANILPGHEIPIDKQLSLETFGREAQDLMSNVSDISKGIQELLNSINREGGLLSRLLEDPKLAERTVTHLDRITQSLDEILYSLNHPKGLAGRLISDQGFGEESTRHLGQALKNLDNILAKVAKGEGASGFLTGKDGEEIVNNLKEISNALSTFSRAMNKENTLASKLMTDEEYGEKLSKNLLSISESLDSILKKIDKGEGSLGAFVNDRDLYNSLSLVAKGIQKSSIVRTYLKNKAEKAAIKEEEKK